MYEANFSRSRQSFEQLRQPKCSHTRDILVLTNWELILSLLSILTPSFHLSRTLLHHVYQLLVFVLVPFVYGKLTWPQFVHSPQASVPANSTLRFNPNISLLNLQTRCNSINPFHFTWLYPSRSGVGLVKYDFPLWLPVSGSTQIDIKPDPPIGLRRSNPTAAMTHLTFLLLEGGVWPRLGITMNCLAAITSP